MKTADVDILIVPGWSNSGPDHWQSRWERNFKTAVRVEQDDWLRPTRDAWVGRVVAAVASARRPVVLVGHSLGVATVLHAAPALDAGILAGTVAGAFLVAPSDLDAWQSWPADGGHDWAEIAANFGAMPTNPLAFQARVIASSDDPFCSADRAHELAALWGADVSIVPNAGHINSDSGHGPWPEGLLTFGMFLRSLPAPVAITLN